jgi:microcystin degradation protein MlrC
LSVTDGVIEDVGHFGNEPFVEAGNTVCLAIDNVRLVLHERPIMGPQPSLFRKVGIEPYQAKIVMLKTGVGYKVTYGLAKAVFRADCPGATSYNLSNYAYTRAPRPLYPLERDMDWESEA